MPKLTPAISHRCREVPCASFFLEVLSSASAADPKSRRQKFRPVQGKPATSIFGFRKKGTVYTVEIGRSYRALARQRNGDYYWFWVGSHEEYNRFRF